MQQIPNQVYQTLLRNLANRMAMGQPQMMPQEMMQAVPSVIPQGSPLGMQQLAYAPRNGYYTGVNFVPNYNNVLIPQVPQGLDAGDDQLRYINSQNALLNKVNEDITQRGIIPNTTPQNKVDLRNIQL